VQGTVESRSSVLGRRKSQVGERALSCCQVKDGTILEDWKKELSCHSIKERVTGVPAKTNVASHCFLALETFCSGTPWEDQEQAYCNETEGTEWFHTSSFYHWSDLFVESHLTGSERVSAATMDCLWRLEGCLDSVDCPTLWLILHSLSIPLTIVVLTVCSTLVCSAVSAWMGSGSDWFEIRSVWDDCTIPVSFSYGLDSWGFTEVWQEQVLAMNLSQIWPMQMMLLCWDARHSYPVTGDYARSSQSVWPGNQLRQDKNQTTVDSSVPQHVQVAGNSVNIVESLTYLGSLMDRWFTVVKQRSDG